MSDKIDLTAKKYDNEDYQNKLRNKFIYSFLTSKPQVTEGEIVAEVLKSWEAQKDNLSPLTRWLAEDAARALLQQFEIRRK